MQVINAINQQLSFKLFPQTHPNKYSKAESTDLQIKGDFRFKM